MKKIIVVCVSLLLGVNSFVAAQDKLKVAVFDPAVSGKDFDEGAGVIIREMVSATIMSTGKYTIIERSLIDRILNEQKFSNSGAVDDSQVSQLGKLAGANKVILSVLSSAGRRALLSLKVIDVESANIESQQTQMVDLSKIYDIIAPTTLVLIGEQAPTAIPATTPTPFQSFAKGVTNAVTSDKKKKLVDRVEKEEMSFPLASQDGAVKLIFKGVSSKKNPGAKIYVNGEQIGIGTFRDGYSVAFNEFLGPGIYYVKIRWLGGMGNQNHKIDTRENKTYEFEWVKGGFGYEFRLKKNK